MVETFAPISPVLFLDTTTRDHKRLLISFLAIILTSSTIRSAESYDLSDRENYTAAAWTH